MWACSETRPSKPEASTQKMPQSSLSCAAERGKYVLGAARGNSQRHATNEEFWLPQWREVYSAASRSSIDLTQHSAPDVPCPARLAHSQLLPQVRGGRPAQSIAHCHWGPARDRRVSLRPDFGARDVHCGAFNTPRYLLSSLLFTCPSPPSPGRRRTCRHGATDTKRCDSRCPNL